MTGNICPMAHASGMDWNTDMFTNMVSARAFSRSSRSSGAYSTFRAVLRTARHARQKCSSTWARSSNPSWPVLNSSMPCSRRSRASW